MQFQQNNFMYQFAVLKNKQGDPLVGNIALPPIYKYQYENPLDANDFFHDVERGNAHVFLLSNKKRVFAMGDNIYGQCVTLFNSLTKKGLNNSTSHGQKLGEVIIPNETITRVVTGINYTLFITALGHVYSVGWNNQKCLGTNNNAQHCYTIAQITQWEGGDFTTIPIIDASASNCYTILIDKDYNMYACGCALNFDKDLIRPGLGLVSRFKPNVNLLPEEKIVKVQCEEYFILYLTNTKRLFHSNGHTPNLIAVDVRVMFREQANKVYYQTGSSWYSVTREVTLEVDPGVQLRESGKDPSKFESYQGFTTAKLMNIPWYIEGCTFHAFGSHFTQQILCSKL
jgi:alpha-tubulin suppressor-like RCC1 family protein